MTRTPARLSAALITLALVGTGAPALAHVTVSSTDAARGGYGKAVFRVPTESDTASTTKLVVTLPEDAPLAFVTAGAKPGWKVRIGKQKLDEPTKVGDSELTEVVRTITWTSAGDGIPPSQFDEFAISGGPFPDAGTMSFSAAQTYSDGKVVRWDEVQDGDEEPAHPAPVLTLAAAEDGAHGAAPSEDVEKGSATTDDDGTDVAGWLAGGALLVAGSALVVALRQNRRRA